MKRILSRIAGCAVCWATVLTVCFGLLCAAAAVPDHTLTTHLLASSDKLAIHGPHEKTVNSLYYSTCDNFADAVLLGIAANMSSDNILRSVLDTRYYDDGYGPAVGIRAIINGAATNVDYTRYWHGSLVFVRPLLAVTDLQGIRIIGAIVICLLLLADAVWLLRRQHKAACVILIVSAILIHLPFVFTTVEYMSVFLILLTALPFYVRFAEDPGKLMLLSAGVGTLTAFFDFLTAETLTLLVPLLLAFFVRAEQGELIDEKQSLRLTVSCGAAWCCAYLLTFASKWAAASLALGQNVSGTAMDAAAMRFTGDADGITSLPEMLFSSLGANLSRLVPTADKFSLPGIAVWMVLFTGGCIFLWRMNQRQHNLPMLTMLLIASLPLIRFSVLMNHSLLHSFFTYRALMATIMAVLGLMWYRVGTKCHKT